ncbi:hypothetical protein SAMN05444360_11963 [Chryseobacterium carnipullorum]|uniref:Uncharacterized protein n=1 Tax=Chryseobacterium carnipullorum TaxID=1124835 RepID=A0A1M7M5D5_CHRCU|nr:hypothetical protein SAMN05444360_11963 [Chryseobacterium carnipullorum]STC94319.1 Uncharacterised protein [Chryseobacterium carnipullorum]
MSLVLIYTILYKNYINKADNLVKLARLLCITPNNTFRFKITIYHQVLKI